MKVLAGWSPEVAQDAAAEVADVLVGGALLPLTVFEGATVFPVVAWDQAALAERREGSVPPMCTAASVLDGWACGVGSSVLDVRGFIGVGAPTSMRRSLRPLRSLARTVGMFARFPSSSPLLAEEFDAQGTALVVVGDGVDVVVSGDPGPLPGSALDLVWRRVFEERLYAWALSCGAVPSTS